MDETGIAAGTLYLADSPKAARVRVFVDSEGVVAKVEDGEHRISFAACVLERGGINGRVWTVRTGDRSLTLVVDDPAFPSALRQRAPSDVVIKLDRILLSSARDRGKLRANWIVALALAGVFVTGTYYGIRTAGAAAVDALPTSVDTHLGDQAFARIKAQSKVIEDPALSAALSSTVARLSGSRVNDGAATFTYRVHLFDDPNPNAFALPGGNLVVHTGLIRAATTPEQLAGVLAHEIAHVERRHGMRRIARSLGVVAAFELILGDVSGLAAVGVDLLREGAINSYSRAQEQQADLDAVETLKRAQIDPNAFADFLDQLRRRDPGLPSALAWIGTHPDLAQRVTDVRTAAGDTRRQRWEPFALDWVDLQRRLPDMSEDTSRNGAAASPSPLLAADD
jgi:predicted Zn-dependent protease